MGVHVVLHFAKINIEGVALNYEESLDRILNRQRSTVKRADMRSYALHVDNDLPLHMLPHLWSEDVIGNEEEGPTKTKYSRTANCHSLHTIIAARNGSNLAFGPVPRKYSRLMTSRTQ